MTTPRQSAPDAGVSVLDLRDLPPPEPLRRALEAVAQLEPGRELVILTPFRPAHLIDQLVARGCTHEATPLGGDGWRTRIQQPLNRISS